MKDVRITYTYHLNSLDVDEEPTTGSLVLQVEDAIAAELLLADLSQSIAGRHIGTAFHCVCEMLLWYCSMHYRYIQGDDKILSISPA